MTNPLSYLVTIVIWTSLVLSTIIVTVGVWQKSPKLLLVSAVLSIPFALYLSLYPSLRFFIVLPALHLMVIPAVRAASPWPRLSILLAIYSLIGVFFAIFIPIWLSQR